MPPPLPFARTQVLLCKAKGASEPASTLASTHPHPHLRVHVPPPPASSAQEMLCHAAEFYAPTPQKLLMAVDKLMSLQLLDGSNVASWALLR
eukprot:365957-Chlamydomonas_euryale.AAC.2